jgi:hypothetical protein
LDVSKRVEKVLGEEMRWADLGCVLSVVEHDFEDVGTMQVWSIL